MGQKITLSESKLKKIISESVKKVLNEISSDMISRASAKLYGKYGWNGSERDKLEKDEHGNPLHPKDKKPMAQHFKNFQDAFKRAKSEEDMNNPLIQQAMKLYKDVEWDDYEVEDVDGGYATGFAYCDVQDENGETWEFSADVYFELEGDWVPKEVTEVHFMAPDGSEGEIPV